LSTNAVRNADNQMMSQNPDCAPQYGTLPWFEKAYAGVPVDPWGLNWRPSQLLRYRRVLSLLDSVENSYSQIMDVGCATGDFTFLLSQSLRLPQVLLGVDFVDGAIERARRRFPSLAFSRESLFSLGDSYPGRFDLITCLEVLYYVTPTRRIEAIQSLRRALRPGGYAVFSSMIASAPYFSPSEFSELISSEFEVIGLDILHLRPVSFLEKAGARCGRLMPHGLSACFHGRFLFAAVVKAERWCQILKSVAASHSILLARSLDGEKGRS
jgi:SAM-dependent methyltransferase